jgi:hypothetical protein
MNNSPSLSAKSAPASTAFWRIDSFGFYSSRTIDRYDAYYYPTAKDRNEPGIFSIDLLNNAQIADMNADGRDDLVLNPAIFPHTIPHAPVEPLLFFNNGATLTQADWQVSSPDVPRHLSYRFALPDLNRDGTADYVSSVMGMVQRNQDGTFTNVWEPVPVLLSDGNIWRDATRSVAGQENYAGFGFGHDFAWGDVNADGWVDFYTGGKLYLNTAGKNFTNGDSLLPPFAAGTTMSNNAGASYAMSSLITDLDRNGYGDLLVWFADPHPDVAGFVAMGGPSRIGDGGILPLPDGLYGDRNTRFNFAIAGDLNHDGYNDVVVGETRVAPYYHGRQIQLLINNGGILADETAIRLPADPRARITVPAAGSVGNGEGQIFLVDINDDGHIDIVDGSAVSDNSPEAQLLVLLNDGTAHFSNMPLSQLPYVQPWQLGGHEWKEPYYSRPHSKMVPIDIDGLNGMDWIGSVQTPLAYWPQTEPTEVTLYTATSSARYGKAGAGREGWQVGVPGFDEDFYLNSYPDARAALARGQYETGLAHYLAQGRADGRHAFAPHTKVWGSERDDVIVLREGNEVAQAGSGNDRIWSGLGDDVVNGGAGLDSAHIEANRSAVRVAVKQDGTVSVSGAEGNDTFVSVERLAFKDGVLAFDLSGNAGQAYRLYQAAFARTPDTPGLKYQTNALDTALNLWQVAGNFIASPEFQSMYGSPATVTDARFVSLLYNNVLGRNPDQAGYDYHLNNLAGGLTRSQLLVQFSESPENQRNVLPAIQEGIWMG